MLFCPIQGEQTGNSIEQRAQAAINSNRTTGPHIWQDDPIYINVGKQKIYKIVLIASVANCCIPINSLYKYTYIYMYLMYRYVRKKLNKSSYRIWINKYKYVNLISYIAMWMRSRSEESKG